MSDIEGSEFRLDDLNKLIEEGVLPLVSASGCASSARRLCDLLVMSAVKLDDELEAAERARDLFALGAVKMATFIEGLKRQSGEKT